MAGVTDMGGAREGDTLSSGPAPLVGVPVAGVVWGSRSPAYAINQTYPRALLAVGLVPLLLPPAPAEALAAVIERLDGLLLPGGADIDPARYGQKRLDVCGEVDPERDELELTLTSLALDRDLPVFGICRGMQTLNVARGGTLYQDLEAQSLAREHDQRDGQPRDYRAHTLRVTPGSTLAHIVKTTTLEVNSLHHQAVREPGKGVRILATAPDGLAEAMEVEGHRFALAVQYHPEELFPTDEPSRALFAAFAQACRMRRAE